MSSTLFILNDAPYGNERAYNGLRLAGALANKEGDRVRVFLMADAVGCAKNGQKVPDRRASACFRPPTTWTVSATGASF